MNQNIVQNLLTKIDKYALNGETFNLVEIELNIKSAEQSDSKYDFDRYNFESRGIASTKEVSIVVDIQNNILRGEYVAYGGLHSIYDIEELQMYYEHLKAQRKLNRCLV